MSSKSTISSNTIHGLWRVRDKYFVSFNCNVIPFHNFPNLGETSNDHGVTSWLKGTELYSIMYPTKLDGEGWAGLEIYTELTDVRDYPVEYKNHDQCRIAFWKTLEDHELFLKDMQNTLRGYLHSLPQASLDPVLLQYIDCRPQIPSEVSTSSPSSYCVLSRCKSDAVGLWSLVRTAFHEQLTMTAFLYYLARKFSEYDYKHDTGLQELQVTTLLHHALSNSRLQSRYNEFLMSLHASWVFKFNTIPRAGILVNLYELSSFHFKWLISLIGTHHNEFFPLWIYCGKYHKYLGHLKWFPATHQIPSDMVPWAIVAKVRSDVSRESWGPSSGRWLSGPSNARAGPSNGARAGPSSRARAGPLSSARVGPSFSAQADPSSGGPSSGGWADGGWANSSRTDGASGWPDASSSWGASEGGASEGREAEVIDWVKVVAQLPPAKMTLHPKHNTQGQKDNRRRQQRIPTSYQRRAAGLFAAEKRREERAEGIRVLIPALTLDEVQNLTKQVVEEGGQTYHPCGELPIPQIRAHHPDESFYAFMRHRHRYRQLFLVKYSNDQIVGLIYDREQKASNGLQQIQVSKAEHAATLYELHPNAQLYDGVYDEWDVAPWLHPHPPSPPYRPEEDTDTAEEDVDEYYFNQTATPSDESFPLSQVDQPDYGRPHRLPVMDTTEDLAILPVYRPAPLYAATPVQAHIEDDTVDRDLEWEYSLFLPPAHPAAQGSNPNKLGDDRVSNLNDFGDDRVSDTQTHHNRLGDDRDGDPPSSEQSSLPQASTSSHTQVLGEATVTEDHTVSIADPKIEGKGKARAADNINENYIEDDEMCADEETTLRLTMAHSLGDEADSSLMEAHDEEDGMNTAEEIMVCVAVANSFDNAAPPAVDVADPSNRSVEAIEVADDGKVLDGMDVDESDVPEWLRFMIAHYGLHPATTAIITPPKKRQSRAFGMQCGR
ncbi:hypothetical protein PUNSTDRAFT_137663 [Punctularia strigosozonata HHB-11173 SS5]|uniref:uncharacterized protein n=1 Tax=Punctularia strigosozonata (strain HHB-11173) TaxID=741275 RepID=UPI00044172C7|nr:uncharacterized protein PUNSTDRAFT_137663 [Punctularia strigosozonata HHB-11173 SS5]EIN05555.1 hypothetical protein PUNSTDRAFT_137663 [Punctularia strigosozonata HHB-11173 SS5]